MAETYNTVEDWVRAYSKIHTSGKTADEMRAELGAAKDIIDARLAVRYATPFTTVPSLVKRLELWIATALLFDRAQETPPWVTGLYDRAMNIMQLLVDGEMNLPGVSEDSTQGGVASTTSAYTPIFGTAPSLAEVIDSDREDAEDDARD